MSQKSCFYVPDAEVYISQAYQALLQHLLMSLNAKYPCLYNGNTVKTLQGPSRVNAYPMIWIVSYSLLILLQVMAVDLLLTGRRIVGVVKKTEGKRVLLHQLWKERSRHRIGQVMSSWSPV